VSIRMPVLLAVGAALVLSGCSSGSKPAPTGSGGSEPPADTLSVAAYNFGESQIIANLYVGALNATGQPAEVRTLTNREIIIPAVEKGDMQIVGDYAATLTEFLNKQVNGPDAPAKASPDLSTTMKNLRELADQQGLTVLEPADAANQNAFAVRKDFAEEHSLKTISDLAAYSKDNPVVVGGPPECPQRPFCLQGLKAAYGLNVAEFRSLDAGGPLTKSALKQGSIDVGLVLTSDGALDQFGLVILEDDRNLQATDNIVPVVNSENASQKVTDTLNKVSAKLTTEALQELNYAVDWKREDPATVADAWLTVNGLG
jgi:osmoprotectant transport system substrate-binding protein